MAKNNALAVARAIVNNPTIIFADEPTGNLDSTTGEVIEDFIIWIQTKRNGVTLIIVTHDADLARKCDIEIRIKDGVLQSVERTNKSASAKPAPGMTQKRVG